MTENQNINIPRITILLLIVGTRGDVQPFIALGQRLRQFGHRVRLATHNTFRKFVRENGLEYYPLAGDPVDLMSFMVKNSGVIPSINSIIAGDFTKNRHILKEILESTWNACVFEDDETGESFIAEAIIANPPSFGHIHCAQKLQIPLHIMFTMPWSPTTAFPHPLINVDYSKASIEKVNMLSYTAIEMFTWSSMRDIVNNFRKDTLGLPGLHTRQAIYMMIDECVPYTYSWSPSLVPKPNDWPDHINVSGFFFLKQDATANTNQSDNLLKFLGLFPYEKNENFSPPIYIGFGSITGHDSDRLLKIILDALNQTGYRALLSGLAKDNDELPETILKIDNVSHDWLFQYVSAVCHHGGAGTTAAGLRAGKPTFIIPFFGDQFFWGNVIEKNGVGPHSIPGKELTTQDLIKAFKFIHQPEIKAAAERIRDAILKEDGCDEAVHAFHTHLPLLRMHSDLESTFPACYLLKDFHLQISRSVAKLLILENRINQSQLSIHPTRIWFSSYDNRIHIPFHGIIKHTRISIVTIGYEILNGIKQSIHSNIWKYRIFYVIQGIFKGLAKAIGHLSIGCLSLYGELTDVLDAALSYFNLYSQSKSRSRPYISDFESGINAAILALYYGFNDGIIDLMDVPSIAYQRHGILGGIIGTLMAFINVLIKPSIGILSSITWLSRGLYATINYFNLVDNGKEANITNTIGLNLSSSIDISNVDNRIAAITEFKPEVCKQILLKFDEIKKQRDNVYEHQHKT